MAQHPCPQSTLPLFETENGQATSPCRSHEPNHLAHVIEVSSPTASGRISTAISVALEAQRRGEWIAWIQQGHASVYMPDLAAAGLDLDAIAFIQAPDNPLNMAKAADWLLRSGAIGLVIMDCIDNPVSAHGQSRLAGLAKKHSAQLLILTSNHEQEHSVSPLVQVRIQPHRRSNGRGEHAIDNRVLKNKTLKPLVQKRALHRAPHGLA